MRLFLAGIMQGSRQDDAICGQDYRTAIREIILAKYPEAEVVCPMELYPESPYYGPREGRRTFLDLTERAREADFLIAYLPEASMGTAIEMWQAHSSGARILTISPMAENWVVKFLSDRVFTSADEFAEFVADGGLETLTSRS